MAFKRTLVECSGCGRKGFTGFMGSDDTAIIDNGLVIRFWECGFHGGFHDGAAMGEPAPDWSLCHDCLVTLLETFPRLAEKVPPGLHSCDDAVPCCRWARKHCEDTDALLCPNLDESGNLVWTPWVDLF
jgi:hypothetical protein